MQTYRSVAVFGFSQHQLVVASPLIRKLWQVQKLVLCGDFISLKKKLAGADVLFCNGSVSAADLELALSLAGERGIRTTACLFLSDTPQASLDCARKHGVDVILADLEDEEELLRCAGAASQGRHFWSEGAFRKHAEDGSDAAACYELLSESERSVYAGLLSGLKHDDIASKLHLRRSSVDTYCCRIFKKFGVSTLAALYRKANEDCDDAAEAKA